MKQLVCEMCGGTDLVKDGGVFVCQTCGCKYSIEEARKMMVEGTVEVVGTVKIDNTAQIQNYLDLSRNAYESGNGQSAFDYANKALEIQPQNSQAWIAKMKSIEYIGTLGDLKLMEVVEAGKNAINNAPEDQKKEITKEVYHYELTRSLTLLKLAMNKMRDTADIESTFKRLALVSVLTAAKNALQIDSKIVNIYDNIANEAMGMVKLVPDEVLAKDSELAKIVGECAKQYQYETDALVARYKIYGAALTSEAQRVRDNNKRALEDKARNAEKLARENEAKEKKARIDAYWAENQELKTQLESEKGSLQQQVKDLESQLDALPEGGMVKDLEKRISDTQREKDGLGLFKGKEKKALQERIDDYNRQLSDAKKAHDNASAPIKDSLSKLKKRISEIDSEFSKDR